MYKDRFSLHAGLNTRETPEELAQDLKKIIRFKFGTLKRFASEANITEPNLQNILNGKRYISQKWAPVLAQKLGMKRDYLMTGKHPIWEDKDKFFTHFDPNSKRIRLTHCFMAHAQITSEERRLIERILELSHRQGEDPSELAHVNLDDLDGYVNVASISELALGLHGKSFNTHLCSYCREDEEYCRSGSHAAPREEDRMDTVEEVYETWIKKPGTHFEFLHLIDYLMLSLNRNEHGEIENGYIEVSFNSHFLIVPEDHPINHSNIND